MDPDVAGIFPVVIVAHVPNVKTQEQIVLRDNCQFIAEDTVGIPICKQSGTVYMKNYSFARLLNELMILKCLGPNSQKPMINLSKT